MHDPELERLKQLFHEMTPEKQQEIIRDLSEPLLDDEDDDETTKLVKEVFQEALREVVLSVVKVD